MKKKQKLFRLSVDISLRREDFGGLMFMPVTGEIFQLNHAGYDLLECVKGVDVFQIIPEDFAFWQELEERSIVKEVISYDRH